MRRREFITLLGGAAAWPVAARAQQSSMPMIGFLGSQSPGVLPDRLSAFHQGLGEAGYVEGRNVAIDYRWAEGHSDRLPELAADLVRQKPAVIATAGGFPAAQAAKGATSTIPVVFLIGADPVENGFVGSLSRPGGNLTGVTTLAGELIPKRLELLHEVVPTASVIGLLFNPTNQAQSSNFMQEIQAAGRTLGLQVYRLQASTERDFDPAFETLAKLHAGGLVIAADAFFNARREQLGALTLRYAMPAAYQTREFTAAGGLMSYDASIVDASRLVGVYAGRILKGEKPADLPVQQSTKVELIINLKTAKALGLTVPPSLLARADEVIE